MKKDLIVNRDSDSYKIVTEGINSGKVVAVENMSDEEFFGMFKNRKLEIPEKPTYEELEKINHELLSVIISIENFLDARGKGWRDLYVDDITGAIKYLIDGED